MEQLLTIYIYILDQTFAFGFQRIVLPAAVGLVLSTDLVHGAHGALYSAKLVYN